MPGTAGEVKKNSKATFSDGILHMDISMLIDQQKITFISSLRTLGALKKTYQERWMTRESKETVLSAWLDDDDNDIYARTSMTFIFLNFLACI